MELNNEGNLLKFVFVCECGYMLVGIRGQLSGVGLIWASNSHHQALCAGTFTR